MNSLPISLQKVSLFLKRLPGIGEKSANRLAFYLLRLPESDLGEFAATLKTLKSKTMLCKNCLNLTESNDICLICSDQRRDASVIMIVEDVLDLLSFETGNIYTGLYHVLHGRIDPLNHIGPEDIYIDKLFERLMTDKGVKEILIATNPDMEGEATAMYLRNRLQEFQNQQKREFKTTRLAYGLPIGANLEYADYMTLKKAMEGRNNY